MRVQIDHPAKMIQRIPNDAEAPSQPTAAIVVPSLSALAMVALSTVAGAALDARWGNGPVDLLYLPPVLTAAVLFGLWPALLASLASALAYNYFFTPPYHTLRMDRPADIVTVAILFLVAIVTSKLAAGIRRQAEIALWHSNRNATIAGFAGRLLTCSDRNAMATIACRELARIFACNAVLLEGLPRPVIRAAEPAAVSLAPNDIATAASVLASGESAGRGARHPYPTDWQFHPVGSPNHTLATVGLARDDENLAVDGPRQDLLVSLLDQLALALERSRLEREASELAALAERGRVRSALISSIGQDLAPPIKSIGNCARQLRRGSPEPMVIAPAIAREVTKLERYLSNLLELEPEGDQRPIEIAGVSIDLARRRVVRDGKNVHLTPKEYSILAELAKHPGRVLTHAHLLRTAWGPAQENQTEYLRVAIRGLRQKLERNPSRPEIILNEPAVGYRLAI